MTQRSVHHLFLCALSIVLAICLVFAPTAQFEFLNFDDTTYITENAFVTSGLSFTNLTWAFSTPYAGHWHPLTWLSHQLDCELFGVAPGAHHLMSVGIHALNTILVFLFLNTSTKALAPSLFAALVFGVHPLRLESVAWVSERKDVLSMFFGLLTLNLYLAFVRARSVFIYCCITLAFLLSLLAKPTFVTLPALLVLLDLWPLNRVRLSSRSLEKRQILAAIVEKIPLALISITLCAIAINSQHLGGGLQNLSGYAATDRIAGAFVSYLAYFGKLLIPTGMGIFYPFQIYAPGVGVGAFLGLLALSYMFLAHWRTAPYLACGWLWFLISALPLIGFVQIGGQAFADRWSYLPTLGPLIGITWWAVDYLSPRIGTRLLRVLATSLVLALGIITHYELPHWRNSETIFTRTLEVSPHNFMAHTNLGSALRDKGDAQRAAYHFEEAVRLNPTYPEALNNLGIVRAEQGRYREAQELFTKAFTIRPDFDQARYNAGLAYSQMGNNVRASIDWSKVLANNPRHASALQSLQALSSWIEPLNCQQVVDSLRSAPPNILLDLRESLQKWPSNSSIGPTKIALERISQCQRSFVAITP